MGDGLHSCRKWGRACERRAACQLLLQIKSKHLMTLCGRARAREIRSVAIDLISQPQSGYRNSQDPRLQALRFELSNLRLGMAFPPILVMSGGPNVQDQGRPEARNALSARM